MCREKIAVGRGGGRTAVYCSNACRQRAYRNRVSAQAVRAEADDVADSPRRTPQPPDQELPEPLDAFIGRDEQLEQIRHRMRSARLVTLVGPGGAGKTRMAIEFARRADGGRCRRVHLVDLTPMSEGDQLVQTTAAALRVREHQNQTPLQSIVDAISTRRLSLLVDNCEHVIEPCAGLITALLRSCSDLRVLATSREPLEVPGEVVLRVEPLPVADVGTGQPRQRLLASDAVQLFLDRAKAANADFELTDDNIKLVAHLCHQLDGLPLAIELAARRVHSMPVHEIVRCLDDQLGLLTQRASTAGKRHSSLRMAIGWSYRLLTPTEKIALNRLSLLSGGFDRAAAAAVCSGGPITPDEVLHIILSLHTKSLLQRISAPGESVRFQMLTSIRLYAREQLHASGDEGEAVHRFVEWMAGLASPTTENSRFFLASSRQLAANRDNMIAALRLLAPTPAHADTQVLLAAAVARCWQSCGQGAAGARLLASVLRETPESVNRPGALVSASWLAICQGDYDEALRYAAEAVELARRQDRPATLGCALVQFASALFQVGRFATCEQVYRQVLALAISIGGSMDIAKCQQNFAWFLLFTGSAGESLTLIQQALPTMRAELGEQDIISALHTSAATHLRLGNLVQARTELLELLRIARSDASVWPYAVEGLAILADLESEPARAVVLLAASDTIRRRLEVMAEPKWREWRDEVSARARKALSTQQVAVAERRGLMMSDDAVLNYVSNGGIDDGHHDALLTAREQQVVALLADGCTNKQIARRLTISVRTVADHLDSIKRKLEFDTRGQIIRWFVESRR